MSTQLTVQDRIYQLESEFNQVNAYKLNFKKEASFALQLLKANDFLKSTAQGNPDSLQNAITNIAAIGISLNPATKEAYLVPRSRSVCLDISAIGLIKLATDSGSIKWAQAEIVRSSDEFFYSGVGRMPDHKMNPFSERGDIVGVYAVAKTHDGDYLVTLMSAKECHEIRDRSEAWKSYRAGKTKSCPWATDEGEMMKKTVLKRASKLWPKSERLDAAVHVLNEHEGIDFNKERRGHIDESAYSTEAPTADTFKALRERLAIAGRSEEQLITYLNTQFKDHGGCPARLEEFNSAQVEYAKRAIESIIEKQGAPA